MCSPIRPQLFDDPDRVSNLIDDQMMVDGSPLIFGYYDVMERFPSFLVRFSQVPEKCSKNLLCLFRCRSLILPVSQDCVIISKIKIRGYDSVELLNAAALIRLCYLFPGRLLPRCPLISSLPIPIRMDFFYLDAIREITAISQIRHSTPCLSLMTVTSD